MKILLVNYEFPPIGGGAGNATLNLARALVKAGHSVDVLTSKLKSESSCKQMEGFKVYGVPSWRKGIHDCGFRGAFTFVILGYLKLLKLAGKTRYDIIQYYFGMPTGLFILLPGLHKRSRCVLSLRGSDVPGYDPYNQRLVLLHQLLLPLTRIIWKKADALLALSHSLLMTALATAPSINYEVIPNGVDPLFLDHQPSARTDCNGLKLITVARLVERKGIQNILHALAGLKDPGISLLIVGEGHFETTLKQICSRLNLNDQVTFYGFCPPSKLPDLLYRADVFILTSYAESFGIAFVEAMGCGLPVIGSCIGGIPDYVGPDNGILVEPSNTRQIGKAIMILKNFPERRRAMGAKNHKKVMVHYSWNHIAHDHLKIYTKILAKGTKRE